MAIFDTLRKLIFPLLVLLIPVGAVIGLTAFIILGM